MLFECSIRSISKELFKKTVYQVRFSSLDEGQLCIRSNHESMQKFLNIGKIIIDLKENSDQKLYAPIEFFNGHGLISMQNNMLHIICFPIVSHIYDVDQNLLDNNGNKYIDLWNRL